MKDKKEELKEGKKKTLEDIQEENRQLIEVMEEASRNYTKYSIISLLIAIAVFITLVKVTEPMRYKRGVNGGIETPVEREKEGNKELKEEVQRLEVPIWEGSTLEELRAVDGLPRVVYFSTTDCKYCVEQEKEFGKMDLEGIEIVHLDKEKHKGIVAELGIEGYPTIFYITKEGEFLDNIGGKEYTYDGGVAEGNLGLKRKGDLEEKIKRLVE